MIPLCTPNMSYREVELASQAIGDGMVSGGPYVDQFEAMVAKKTGKKWCVATQTGTAALHLALSLNVADAFIMPSYTFIAAANVASHLGKDIVFRDIEENWSPDYSFVATVCDAAPAISKFSEINWRGGPDLACLSFNANKVITTGQGGAVVGDNPELGRKIRHLATVCKSGTYTHDGIGFNYRMSNINAAVGVGQMERLDELQENKDNIISYYKASGLKMMSSCWMALWETDNRDKKISELNRLGIEAKPFWKPLHLQEPYKYCKTEGALPRTEELWKKMICLPCSTHLTRQDQDKVIEVCLSL